ncbi:MAG TPA: hypothetical protein VJW77_06325 [Terriglobia bacterium]|nr:hypothetical protein [Terriglobia bacterium]
MEAAIVTAAGTAAAETAVEATAAETMAVEMGMDTEMVVTTAAPREEVTVAAGAAVMAREPMMVIPTLGMATSMAAINPAKHGISSVNRAGFAVIGLWKGGEAAGTEGLQRLHVVGQLEHQVRLAAYGLTL